MKNWDMDERCRKGDSTESFQRQFPQHTARMLEIQESSPKLEGHLWKREELVVRH